MKKYLRSLNWSGFWMMLILCGLGLGTNESVVTFGIWAFMMLIFGVPIACFFLFAIGRE